MVRAGLIIRGVTTASKAKGKVLTVKTRKVHTCASPIFLPLEKSLSLALSQAAIWNYSPWETFPLKLKGRGLRIAFTVSFIY